MRCGGRDGHRPLLWHNISANACRDAAAQRLPPAACSSGAQMPLELSNQHRPAAPKRGAGEMSQLVQRGNRSTGRRSGSMTDPRVLPDIGEALAVWGSHSSGHTQLATREPRGNFPGQYLINSRETEAMHASAPWLCMHAAPSFLDPAAARFVTALPPLR